MSPQHASHAELIILSGGPVAASATAAVGTLGFLLLSLRWHEEPAP